MVGLKIYVETGWPGVKLWPNNRSHRMQVWRSQNQARKEAYWATCMVKPRACKPDGGRFKLTIHAHPAVARSRDDDGLISACKSFRDGIAEALGVDDKLFDVQPVVWGEKDPRGRVFFGVESTP